MSDDLQPTVRVLSLGAGVQSTALLMLSAEGALPRLDAAIFSDTGWEPQAVYDHLDQIDLFEHLADLDEEEGAENGCSPFACRSDGL